MPRSKRPSECAVCEQAFQIDPQKMPAGTNAICDRCCVLFRTIFEAEDENLLGVCSSCGHRWWEHGWIESKCGLSPPEEI